MVTLKPIEQADFDAFLENGIVEYAADKVRSGNWPEEAALERSRQEWMKLLPEGPRTKGQLIYSISDEDSQRKVGIVWVHVMLDQAHREAFLYDLRIDEGMRRKGYGRQALDALDEKLMEMGIESVSLHVFAYNTTAIELYKKVGYEITNIHMRKTYPQVR